MAARLSADYNCAHFLCDAWEQETGEDIRPAMGCFLAPALARTAAPSLVRALRLLPRPVGPCVVLWRRRGAAPHVGLYSRRTVVHLTESGPIRQQLAVASLGYHSTRFYAPRPHHCRSV